MRRLMLFTHWEREWFKQVAEANSLHARDLEVFFDRASGLTFREIGILHGVSGSRAAQIFDRFKKDLRLAKGCVRRSVSELHKCKYYSV